MKLGRSLLQLVAVAVAPPIVLAALLGYLLIDHERETFRAGAIARVRAFMTAVDAAVHGHFSTLEALAADRNLLSGDIGRFERQARSVLTSQPSWINVFLTLPSGQQLVNVQAEPGAALPADPETKSHARVVSTKSNAVGDVVMAPVIKAYAIPLRVPVLRRGEVVYVLTALVQPQSFEGLIRSQDLPPAWSSGLTDASGRFIARVPYRSPSEFASANFKAAVQRESEGWYRGVTVEGRDTFTAHKTSELTGWHVGLAVPADLVTASAYRTSWIVGIGGLATMLLALGLAYAVGRRISKPMTELARAASSMREDGTLASVHTYAPITEVREIAQALTLASAAIRQRHMFLESEQERLTAASRQKDEFLAMLGHELRNPLSVMTMSAGVLRLAGGSGPAAERALTALEHQTQYMRRLIDDLLDVSRLTHGKISLRLEPFELSALVGSIADSWWAARRRTPARVAVDDDAVWVNADKARLEQVIVNLLDNADKFSPVDSVIRLAIRQEDGEAVLAVTDAGEGIPPAMLDRIFEPFVQGATGADRGRGGLGIGLTLVKRLIELHGGTVSVASGGTGQGATFTVRLPAITPPAAAQISAGGGAAPKRRLRVMLVEDNADARELAMHLLQAEGHEVLVLQDGDSALAQARAWRPDIVLLDIGLPGMDGYEVARRLRAGLLAPRVPLVAISGYGQPDDVRLAAAAGFDLHITKPVTAEAMRAALQAEADVRTPAHQPGTGA